jgi:hypothetical protein
MQCRTILILATLALSLPPTASAGLFRKRHRPRPAVYAAAAPVAYLPSAVATCPGGVCRPR